MSAEYAPDYEPPQPGERDSLAQIFTTFEAALDRLTEEAFLHVEMYPDHDFCSDLLSKISWTRQGLQNLESELCVRILEVVE